MLAMPPRLSAPRRPGRLSQQQRIQRRGQWGPVPAPGEIGRAQIGDDRNPRVGSDPGRCTELQGAERTAVLDPVEDGLAVRDDQPDPTLTGAVTGRGGRGPEHLAELGVQPADLLDRGRVRRQDRRDPGPQCGREVAADQAERGQRDGVAVQLEVGGGRVDAVVGGPADHPDHSHVRILSFRVMTPGGDSEVSRRCRADADGRPGVRPASSGRADAAIRARAAGWWPARCSPGAAA